MTKRRMAQVMRQAHRFNQVLVGAKSTCDRASDLGYFEGMSQPCTVVIAFMNDKYLLSGTYFQSIWTEQTNEVDRAFTFALTRYWGAQD